MPYAPTYDPQTQAPRGSDTRFRAADDNGGLAGGIARGLQSAARGISQAGEIELQIQERFNTAQARSLRLKMLKELQPVLSEYQTLQGEDAVNGAEAVRNRVTKARESYMATASNPRMRELFSQITEDDVFRVDGQIVEYSAKQAFKMELDVAGAELTNAQLGAKTSYKNPVEHEAYISTVEERSREIGDKLGETAEVINLRVLKDVSQARSEALTSMLSSGDPADVDFAIEYFSAYEDELLPADRNRIAGALEGPKLNRWADNELNLLVSGAAFSPAAADAGGGGGVASSPEAPASTPRQMPVPTTRVSDNFAAHQRRGSAGIDFPAAAGTAIKPVAEGVVVEAGTGETGGNFIRIRHADGSMTSYMHMQARPQFKQGDRVTPSTVIGTVGSTGRASGPHLHLEVKDAQGRQVDPEPYLKGTVPLGTPEDPRQWDTAGTLAKIEERRKDGTYTPEEADVLRERFLKRVQQDEQILGLREKDAIEGAQRWLMDHLDSFTSYEQIPAEYRQHFSPGTALQWTETARRNAEAQAGGGGEGGMSGGALVSQIKGAAAEDPDAFIDADLTQYAPGLTQTQYASLLEDQRKARAAREEGKLTFDPSSKITTAINTHSAMDGLSLPKDGSDRRAIAALMHKFVVERFDAQNGKPLTDADYADAYRYATQKTRARVPGVLWGESFEDRPRYKIERSVERAQTFRDQDMTRRAQMRERNAAITAVKSRFRQRYGREPNQNELASLLAEVK